MIDLMDCIGWEDNKPLPYDSMIDLFCLEVRLEQKLIRSLVLTTDNDG